MKKRFTACVLGIVILILNGCSAQSVEKPLVLFNGICLRHDLSLLNIKLFYTITYLSHNEKKFYEKFTRKIILLSHSSRSHAVPSAYSAPISKSSLI